MLEFLLETIIHGVICAIFCSLFHLLIDEHLHRKKYKKLIKELRLTISEPRTMILTKSEPSGKTAERYRNQLRSEILQDFDKKIEEYEI